MDRADTDLAAGAEDGTDAGAADDEDRGAVPRAGDDAGAGGAGAAAGGDDTAAGADDEDVAPAPSGLSWPKVAVLGLALAFLGFAVGIFVSRDRPPGPDSADVGFLQDMLTHHDQALGVATLTVAYGEDPIVRSMAREVVATQSFEIGLMTQKLADWGYSRDERSDQAMAWMDMPVPVEDMPGLLSDEQLAAVEEARGPELDALFLELMAEHHRGGLHMAEGAATLADDEDVRELAARMRRNQAGEINEYRLRAEELGLDLDIAPPSVPPAGLPGS
ncbi:MAG: DUF305 domain-containing protein [Thermoanaerobacterales bacterium]|jgi:uncharacterized protein (DUF305 family)